MTIPESVYYHDLETTVNHVVLSNVILLKHLNERLINCVYSQTVKDTVYAA